MHSNKDYYAVLGVAESAEDVVIRAAYKALAQKYHPDKNSDGTQSSSASMADINEAYRVLRDPVRRKEYDQLRKEPHSQQRPDAHQSTQRHEQTSTRKTSSRTFPIPDIANWSAEQVQQLQAGIARELGVAPDFQDASFGIKRRAGFFGAATDTEMVSCPQMVVIPCGRVTWRLEVSQPFALGRFAVSSEQFLAFCRATGRKKPKESKAKNRPVVNLSWCDAAEYCEWLSSATGAHYRLPERREWEYACRAGTTGETYFGRLPSPKEVNYGGVWAVLTGDEPEIRGLVAKPSFPKAQYSNGLVNVDCYAPNPWGLYQMHGNVDEYVADILPGDKRTACGGNWKSPVEYLRSDYFLGKDAQTFLIEPRDIGGIGFRVARTF